MANNDSFEKTSLELEKETSRAIAKMTGMGVIGNVFLAVFKNLYKANKANFKALNG